MRVEVPFGFLGASLVVLAFLFSAVGIPAWIPPAPIVRLGVPSPLSGMTRSFVALASGDLRSSFARHPLGPPAFAVCIAMPLIAITSWARGGRFQPLAHLARSRALWVGVALLFALAWTRLSI